MSQLHIPSSRELRKRLKDRGWQVIVGGKHEQAVHPSGHKVALPCSPSDRRGVRNFMRDVQRIEEGKV